MKIDREYFDNAEFRGIKEFRYHHVGGNIGAYISADGAELWFEIDTLERIGGIYVSDNRTNFKRYFYSRCTYGWNGKHSTEKECCKGLCTKAEYQTARALLFEEYKNRKAV